MVASVDAHTSRCSVPAQCRSKAAACSAEAALALLLPSSRSTRSRWCSSAMDAATANALWVAKKPSSRRESERKVAMRGSLAAAFLALAVGGDGILWWNQCGRVADVTRTV
uniref:Uncharacterized protein n=1 Tax=Arundo donax TaxID=35708 RepID=A0A0A9G5B7_ARUDO